MEATRPGVQALAEVFACGMLTGVLKGASTPWSAATASSVHFPARLPFPGQHGPSGLRERRPTDTAATSPGSPCAWRPSSSDGSSRTRSGVQAAAWLWAQPGSRAGPAPGGVDTAPSRPTPLTVQGGRPPRSLAHAAVRPAPPSPARARACGAQGEASWPRSQGTSAVSGRSTRCSGGGLALAPCGSLPSALRPALGGRSATPARGGWKPAVPFADSGQTCSVPFHTVPKQSSVYTNDRKSIFIKENRFPCPPDKTLRPVA